jgi:hypothetical protein
MLAAICNNTLTFMKQNNEFSEKVQKNGLTEEEFEDVNDLFAFSLSLKLIVCL